MSEVVTAWAGLLFGMIGIGALVAFIGGFIARSASGLR